ncbi:hypothetical protein CRG98_005199 [Punica granatum]|uniref:Uncharacterized protein n=1 Tax=Punica granatum TaxID=22663 RepID=A0A2I0L141_PUNGR|nr:hypothetical protein CRG98_005199 [Punica granatum]
MPVPFTYSTTTSSLLPPPSSISLTESHSLIGIPAGSCRMIGVGAPFSGRTALRFPAAADQPSGSRSVACSPACFSGFPPSARLCQRKKLRCGFRSILISCKSSSRGSSGGRSVGSDDGSDGDYLPASLLLAETVSHYCMLQQGYEEEVKWLIARQFHPFSMQVKGPRADSGLISQDFLRRFPNPTIFLKITCDGDFVLPIIVGEYSIEKLIDAHRGDDNRNCPDQFQFVKSLPEKFGYKRYLYRQMS